MVNSDLSKALKSFIQNAVVHLRLKIGGEAGTNSTRNVLMFIEWKRILKF